MAVPAYLRQESKAEFITIATRLAAWALKWCKDERLFSRRERWIVTGDLWTAAKGVLMCAKRANSRRNLTDPVEYAEREKYLRLALDHITDMKVLLTIKYEMMLQGFDAPKAPPEQAAKEEAKPGSPETPAAKKQKRGGRKTLTQDDVDRIFEIFLELAIKEKGLIEGLIQSDAKRHASAWQHDHLSDGRAVPPEGRDGTAQIENSGRATISPDAGPAAPPRASGVAHR